MRKGGKKGFSCSSCSNNRIRSIVTIPWLSTNLHGFRCLRLVYFLASQFKFVFSSKIQIVSQCCWFYSTIYIEINMSIFGIQWDWRWNKWRKLTENPLSINSAFMKLNVFTVCFTLAKSIMKSIYLVFTIIGWVESRCRSLKLVSFFLPYFYLFLKSRYSMNVFLSVRGREKSTFFANASDYFNPKQKKEKKRIVLFQ